MAIDTNKLNEALVIINDLIKEAEKEKKILIKEHKKPVRTSDGFLIHEDWQKNANIRFSLNRAYDDINQVLIISKEVE